MDKYSSLTSTSSRSGQSEHPANDRQILGDSSNGQSEVAVSNGVASLPEMMLQNGDHKSRKRSIPSTSEQTDSGPDGSRSDGGQLTIEAAESSSSLSPPMSPRTAAAELRLLQELTGMAALNEFLRNDTNVEVTEVVVNGIDVTFVDYLNYQ
ncbi:hypothetical protein TTRE_0000394401 [Trichuris trichiura]|uniref:Uncharacterized protein n=1 Tax=Trichuris trichiura TaxID=36087 RepID=A0A077Z692_TRITR|nr:hypothetical protein TTRE_0000394401 [Trichuris trichiura]